MIKYTIFVLSMLFAGVSFGNILKVESCGVGRPNASCLVLPSERYAPEILLKTPAKAISNPGSSDYGGFERLVRDFPGEPWMQVIDPDQTLLADVKKMPVAKVPEGLRQKYLDALNRLKSAPSPLDALFVQHYYSLYSGDKKYGDGVTLYLSNSDPKVLNSIAKNVAYPKCERDQAKYDKIIKDKPKCGGPDIYKSSKADSLYTALAELASCKNYSARSFQVGNIEIPGSRNVTEEGGCPVAFNTLENQVERGDYEIQMKHGAVTKFISYHQMGGSKTEPKDLTSWRNFLNMRAAMQTYDYDFHATSTRDVRPVGRIGTEGEKKVETKR